MELAEVYNIRYYGPDDNLRGIIMTSDISHGGQFLFNDMDHLTTQDPVDVLIDYDCLELYQEADKQLDVSSKPLIRSGDFIMLNGPAQASICSRGGFILWFYLFGVLHDFIVFRKYVYEETLSLPLHELIQVEDCDRQLMIRYAVFNNAIEACVKVKLTQVNSAFDFSGTILARTSAITDPDYTSILFSKDRDEKIRLEPTEEMILQLSRQFVVVPLGSQLILQFALHVDDYEELKTVSFVAKREVTSSLHEIVYDKGVIQLEVSWRSERHPRDFKGANNGYAKY